MQSRLTRSQQRILAALDRRSMDVFDLADIVNLNVGNTDKSLLALCRLGLAHRMYAEDEASITTEGRAALAKEGK